MEAALNGLKNGPPGGENANNPQRHRRRVAIIGGGSAGVVQAEQFLKLSRELREDQGEGAVQFVPTIFERRSVLGAGLWALDEDPGPCHILFDDTGRAFPRWDPSRRNPPSAMYEGLRTNIPFDLMTYRDAPYGANADAPFPPRYQVEDYLVDYAEQHLNVNGTSSDVRLNTAVTRLERVAHHSPSLAQHGGGSVWRVESHNLETGQVTAEDDFEYVVIANGRCNVPSIPPIRGLWRFPGRILHSAWYRSPWQFADDRTVLIVGNASSGMDIARELSGHIVREETDLQTWVGAKTKAGNGDDGHGTKAGWLQRVAEGKVPHILNSFEDVTQPPALDYDPRDEASPSWSHRIEVVSKISHVDEEGAIILDDGRVLAPGKVDILVFATGFGVQYDFCDQETSEPFKSAPLVPSKARLSDETELDGSLKAYVDKRQGGQTFKLQTPVASGPASLDDWYLFYEADRSLAILGLPTGNVPFPLTHVQSRFVAAFWAGKAQQLPPLDRDLPPTDSTRWFTPLDANSTEVKSRGLVTEPMPLLFGHPSDMDYLGELSFQYCPFPVCQL